MSSIAYLLYFVRVSIFVVNFYDAPRVDKWTLLLPLNLIVVVVYWFYFLFTRRRHASSLGFCQIISFLPL